MDYNELKELYEQEFNSKPYYMQQFIGNYNPKFP